MLIGPPDSTKDALVASKPIAEPREANLKALGAAFEKLPAGTHCAYVSSFGAIPPASLTKDGVHPDAAGNQPLAKHLYPALEKLAGIHE